MILKIKSLQNIHNGTFKIKKNLKIRFKKNEHVMACLILVGSKLAVIINLQTTTKWFRYNSKIKN